MRFHKGVNEKLLRTLSSQTISRNSLIKKYTSFFLCSNDRRRPILDVIIAHAASQIALVFEYHCSGL